MRSRARQQRVQTTTVFILGLLAAVALIRCTVPVVLPLREPWRSIGSGEGTGDAADGTSISEGTGAAGTGLPLGFVAGDDGPVPYPFAARDLWPHVLKSTNIPLAIFYRTEGELGTAQVVRHHLERVWRLHGDELGFDPPIFHGGDAFAVFLWRDAGFCLSIPGEPAEIGWVATTSFLVFDPWTGCPDTLEPTLAHEFHRAVLLGYDPDELESFRAANATFTEDLIFDAANRYLAWMPAYQSRPDLGIAYALADDPAFDYGASLFLFFLKEQVFTERPHFLAEVWTENRQMPRPAGLQGLLSPMASNPSWVPALSDILPDGLSFNEVAVSFATWRFFVGTRAGTNDLSGRHFSEGGLFDDNSAVPAPTLDVDTEITLTGELHETGSAYFVLEHDPGGRRLVDVTLEGDTIVLWDVRLVHLGDPEYRAERVRDSFRFDSDEDQALLIVTVLPRGVYNPRYETPYPFTLRLRPGQRSVEGAPVQPIASDGPDADEPDADEGDAEPDSPDADSPDTDSPDTDSPESGTDRAPTTVGD